MRYTRQERLDIGKDIYDDHLSYREAAKKYSVSVTAVQNYYRQYLDEAGLTSNKSSGYLSHGKLEALSKEDIIDEIIRARFEKELVDKGYMVKGRRSGKGSRSFKQAEFEAVYKLSAQFPVARICKVMDINRSGYYKWLARQ